jgi:O-antigen/teichoic acid export membrane protein
VTGTLAQFTDRYLIALLIDLEHVGVYTLFFQLANAMYTLVSSSIVNMHRPRVLSAFQRGDVGAAKLLLRNMQKEAVGGMLIMSTVVGISFHYAAPLLNRPLVLEYLPMMWATFAAAAIKTWCLTDFIELFARRLDGQLLMLNVLILLMVALGCYVFVSLFGIYGIALSTGVAYTLALIRIRHIVIMRPEGAHA